MMPAKNKGLSHELDSAKQESAFKKIAVEYLRPGKYQPRRNMNSEALEELAASIRQQGIMQPIVVRPLSGDYYEIIAGERRWRAAQLAGLEFVPVLVRYAKDRDVIALALIENLQRVDLNPLEEAVALQRLQKEFELTQQQVADAVGKSRSSVTNLLRLLQLGTGVQRLLEQGDLEMGHARALLGLPEAVQLNFARQIVAKGMSVRQAETLIRNEQQSFTNNKAKNLIDPDIARLEEQLQTRLGANVKIQHSAKGKGKLEIHYSSLTELDGILRHLR